MLVLQHNPPYIQEGKGTMVSTVTATTISTVTTVAIAGSLALISILTLLTLLVQKELTTPARGRLSRALGRILNIGIVPLLIVFAWIVAARVVEVLR